MRRERGMQCLVTESEERKDVGGWGVKIDVNKKLDALSMEIMALFIALVTPILNAGVFMHCERGKYFVRIWLLKYYIVFFVIAFLFCKSYSQ